jgi:hypothetical protein
VPLRIHVDLNYLVQGARNAGEVYVARNPIIKWWHLLCTGAVLLAISAWYFIFGIVQGIDLGIEVGWPYDRYLAICGVTGATGLGLCATAFWRRFRRVKGVRK